MSDWLSEIDACRVVGGRWVDATGAAVRIPFIDPGVEIKTMSIFRFPLGAAVVLATSLAAAHQQLSDQEEDRRRSHGGTISSSAVTLRAFPTSLEAGTVIGRAEYQDSPNSYLVRYRAGDGRQTEAWWNQDAIAWDPRAPARNDSNETDPGFAEVDEPVAPAAADEMPVNDPDAGPRIRVCRFAADGGITSDVTIPLV